MLNKVNVTFFGPFLSLHYEYKLKMWFNQDVFFVSLLFRIVSSLNHIYLPQLMFNKVNVTLLEPFLSLHYVYKLTMWLNHDVFFVSLLFRIV